jgi:hypothetical protein
MTARYTGADAGGGMDGAPAVPRDAVHAILREGQLYRCRLGWRRIVENDLSRPS